VTLTATALGSSLMTGSRTLPGLILGTDWKSLYITTDHPSPIYPVNRISEGLLAGTSIVRSKKSDSASFVLLDIFSGLDPYSCGLLPAYAPNLH
jgi:hypothetical protein